MQVTTMQEISRLSPCALFESFLVELGARFMFRLVLSFQSPTVSNGPQEDPIDLEISRGDATSQFEIRGNINSDGSTTVSNFVAADPANNVLPDVQMAAPIFSSADENTHLVYYFDTDSWSPVAVSLVDSNRLLFENSISPDGSIYLVGVGANLRRVPPKSIWISRFAQVASSSPVSSQRMVRMVGFRPINMTKVQNVMLLGCLLDEAQSFENCYVASCKTACQETTSATYSNIWIGCYIDGANTKSTVMGEGDQISGNARSLFRGDSIFTRSASSFTVFNAMSDGCTLTINRGSICVFPSNYALFGQEIQAAIRDGGLLRRSLLLWDNSGSGNPVVTWPGTAGAVFEAPTLVPPGPALPPPSTDWIGYNSGSGSWVGQLTGARMTR